MPACRIEGHCRRAVDAALGVPMICWGLSSFCAESGDKCRAAGACVFAPRAPEKD
jgi:hypothetical protein